MITLDNISYRYGRHATPALQDVTARLDRGIHLLLGENGAGKTTLLHIIAGLRHATTGSCMVDGIDTSRRMPSTLSRIFFVGDEMAIPAKTVNQFREVHAPFYPRFSQEVLSDCLAAFAMTGDEPIDALSLGNRKKALLAYAISLRTPVLLLDEPANGLDINTRKTLRRIMSAHVSDEQCVIVSTHSVADLAPLYDSVMVLTRSRMLLNASTALLQSRLSFPVTTEPLTDALYSETDMGRRRSIVANPDGEPLTEVDFSLLYSGLLSDSCSRILNTINHE